MLFSGDPRDLMPGAMNENQPDVQRTENGQIEQDVREVLGLTDFAIEGNHEYPVAKTRNVLEYAPEVGELHVASAMPHE